MGAASDAHLDLMRAPCVLYGVKYIDLASFAPFFRPAVQRGNKVNRTWGPKEACKPQTHVYCVANHPPHTHECFALRLLYPLRSAPNGGASALTEQYHAT